MECSAASPICVSKGRIQLPNKLGGVSSNIVHAEIEENSSQCSERMRRVSVILAG